MAEDVFGIVGTTQAGNFRVEKVVAEGGFAVVYRALHGGFRAPVALKCLKVPDTMTGEQRAIFLEKFREEAELMFRLSGAIAEVCRPLHVDVLQLGDKRFVPFLALEWLDGESLDGIITRRREQRQPPLGLHKVVKMMRPVAAALAKAHRFPGPQGAVAVIHRDLKPENLFVASIGGSESMKILDFGIAKAKRAASQAVGRVTGRTIAEDEMASFTPAYGAPEQWIPKTWGETGPWTDVWGLALTMSEALCGAPPLDGEPWAMRRACLDDKRRPTPRNHGADIPGAVEKVFEQALALDPRKRFNTIEAFWSELERAMGLPPSLGPRDDRREPGERSDVHELSELTSESPKITAATTAVAKDPAPVTGERLARIELQKVNAASIRVDGAVVGPGLAPPAVTGLPGAPASSPGSSAPPSSRRMKPAQEAAVSSRLPAPPPPRQPEPSGNWEFDLASQRPSRPAMDLEMNLQNTGDAFQGGSGGGPRAPADAASMRRSSLELEMFLPTRSEPPGPPSSRDGSLEMSLPTRSEPPGPPSSSRASVPQAPASVRQPRPDLSPFSDDPAVLPARAAALDDSPLDFELHVPSRPQNAGAPPPSPSSPGAAPGGPRASMASSSGAFDVVAPSVRRPAMGGAPYRPRGAEEHDVRNRLRAPLGMLLLALAIATTEMGYHKATGGDLTFGGLRPFYVAAPLALLGVVFTLWRLMEDRDDG
jgi:eukaryotic-like serine/threonine-protein kinase